MVRRRLGVRKASFPDAATTLALTGMALGRDRIVLGGGSRARKLLTPPALLVAAGAEVVDGLAS